MSKDKKLIKCNKIFLDNKIIKELVSNKRIEFLNNNKKFMKILKKLKI